MGVLPQAMAALIDVLLDAERDAELAATVRTARGEVRAACEAIERIRDDR